MATSCFDSLSPLVRDRQPLTALDPVGAAVVLGYCWHTSGGEHVVRIQSQQRTKHVLPEAIWLILRARTFSQDNTQK